MHFYKSNNFKLLSILIMRLGQLTDQDYLYTVTTASLTGVTTSSGINININSEYTKYTVYFASGGQSPVINISGGSLGSELVILLTGYQFSNVTLNSNIKYSLFVSYPISAGYDLLPNNLSTLYFKFGFGGWQLLSYSGQYGS